MALIIFAPNIHTGGGLVLLQALANEAGARVTKAILDARLLQTKEPPFFNITSLWVRNTLPARLHAEWLLSRIAQPDDTVLCLHSLPPLLPLKARTLVLVQNRLLLESTPLSSYPLKTMVRIFIERLWASHLQQRVHRYIVQTPSMARSLKQWLHRPVPISVIPFAPTPPTLAPSRPSSYFDFIYLASGEAHKNHRLLLQAWQLLSESGLRPSLALTIDEELYPELAAHILQYAAQHKLAVSNLGTLPQGAVHDLYAHAGALIFPSLLESFGLPLIEATQHGLPILASELDYVRDVAQPAQTFDPQSAISIARSVRRHLGQAEATLSIGSARQLLDEVLL